MKLDKNYEWYAMKILERITSLELESDYIVFINIYLTICWPKSPPQFLLKYVWA